MQCKPLLEAEAAEGVETVEKGEGLVQDLHAYLETTKIIVSATMVVRYIEARRVYQKCAWSSYRASQLFLEVE